jgi:glycogen synthase
VEGGEAPERWDEYRRRVGRGLQAADLVVAPTRAMLGQTERHYGPLRATRVIPNGRAPERFPPLVKERFVIAAGRLWDRAKNLSALAAAAPALAWPVLLAGEGQHPEGGAPGLAQVELLGHLPSDELAALLGRAPIYALPAYYEPFGLSALEAALARCALVLGDIDSLRELWEGAAMFVAPGDPEALVKVLGELIDDPVRRERLGRAARRRALALTPQRMAAEYLRCYHELARRPRRSQARPASGASRDSAARPLPSAPATSSQPL